MNKKTPLVELNVDFIGGEKAATAEDLAELDAYFRAKKLERAAKAKRLAAKRTATTSVPPLQL